MPDFAQIIQQVLAQAGRAQSREDRQPAIEDAAERMRVLNSQLEVFYATRRILDDHVA